MKYRLRREKNAISEFVAVVQFFGPVTAPIFSLVSKKLSELKDSLDLPAQINLQFIEFAPVGQVHNPIGEAPSGLGYQRFSKSGDVEESIVCENQTITYSLKAYTRWEQIKPKLLDAFEALAEIYARQIPAISSIRLQYLNEFLATDEKCTSASELFRPNNQWLPGYVYGLRDAWHVHTGSFSPGSKDNRELCNVNFDYGQINKPDGTPGVFRMGVLILGGIFYNTPGGKPLNVNRENIREVLDAHLERAHIIEKTTLRQIFSDSYLSAMGDDGK